MFYESLFLQVFLYALYKVLHSLASEVCPRTSFKADNHFNTKSLYSL